MSNYARRQTAHHLVYNNLLRKYNWRFVCKHFIRKQSEVMSMLWMLARLYHFCQDPPTNSMLDQRDVKCLVDVNGTPLLQYARKRRHPDSVARRQSSNLSGKLSAVSVMNWAYTSHCKVVWSDATLIGCLNDVACCADQNSALPLRR